MGFDFLKFGRIQDRGTLRCPFCRDPLFPAPTVTRCGKCRTIHHEKCWEDSRRCSVYGCRGTPQQEFTEFFLIELFQKRRKKLLLSWVGAAVMAVITTFFLFHLLKPVMPVEGRMIFAGAVVLFLLVIILLSGYAQYLCPACGHQPNSVPDVHDVQTIQKIISHWVPTYYVGPKRHLLLNPSECPNCHTRLR